MPCCRDRFSVVVRLPLVLIVMLCFMLPAQAQDSREKIRAEIEALSSRIAVAAEGPAERLADQELARAKTWIEQAEEAAGRRNLGYARMLFNNAAMDVKVAEAMVENFSLVQERKQLAGQVEVLKKTVEEAQMMEAPQ